MTNDERSVIDQYESFPRGAQELAAARLAQSVTRALDSSLVASGKTAREVADLLGVTEGAVSQVMSSDGNIRIATLGRYLRAMGYQARVEVSPAEESAPPVAQTRRRPRRDSLDRRSEKSRENAVSVSVSRCNVTDGNVVAQALLLVLSHEGAEMGQPAGGDASAGPSAWHVLDASIADTSHRGGWRTSPSVRSAAPETPRPRNTAQGAGARK